VLPLAITMMAGPQIMSAIIFVTAERAVRLSLAFLCGVLAATVIGVGLARGLAGLLGDRVHFGAPSDAGSVGSVIQYVLVGLLILAAVRTYRHRDASEPPRWLGPLMSAGPGRALLTGFLLVLLFPSDVVVLLTVGANLEHHRAGLTAAVPFVLATLVIAALPLLAVLLFHRRATRVMPKVRDWINTHSWLVKIIANLFFVVIILSSG
jgi:hypothetical protein